MATAVSSARTSVPRAVLYPAAKALKGPKLVDAMHRSLYPHLYEGSASGNLRRRIKQATPVLKRYRQVQVEKEKQKVSWFRNKMRSSSSSTFHHYTTTRSPSSQPTSHCPTPVPYIPYTHGYLS
jgi:hypothetical protein